MAVFDPAETLTYGNRAFRIAMELDDHDHPQRADLMRRCLEERQGAGSHLSNGREIYITEMTASDGWLLWVLTDVTKLFAHKRHLRLQLDQARRAALTDELTGVSNRRHLLRFLASALEAVDEVATTVVSIDMDHFKLINDRYGHAAGDGVLRHFAHLMRSQIRREDVGGRLGGEEFLLVLRDTDLDRASELVQRLVSSVASAAPLKEHPLLRYSFSAGVAQAVPGESVDHLLRRADKAMYRAKSEGRGRFIKSD